MAAKIGILGETTVGTAGTVTTVYTVPTDKAARVRVIYAEEGGGAGLEFGVMIGTPNDEIWVHQAMDSGDDVWTGSEKISSPNPADSLTVSGNHGLMDSNNFMNISANTESNSWLIAPLIHEYILSTGDTVKIVMDGANTVDGLFQVIGVEDDA
jgi:hypothetical protein